MVVIYIGDIYRGGFSEVDLVIIDFKYKCIIRFRGIFLVVSLAFGIFVLVLEANKDFIWRDF